MYGHEHYLTDNKRYLFHLSGLVIGERAPQRETSQHNGIFRSQ